MITADRDWYTFSYRFSNEPYKTLAKGETRYLSTEVGGMFTGIYLAMDATGNGKPSAVYYSYASRRKAEPINFYFIGTRFQTI